MTAPNPNTDTRYFVKGYDLDGDYNKISWRPLVKELMAEVASLVEQNKRLSEELKKKEGCND